MSGLICAQKQLPLSSLHHTNGWKNSASRYDVFISYISYIIWSQKWSGAAVTQWHRFALQEAVSWDRTVTGGGKRQPQLLWHSKPQTCVWQLQAELAGPGAPGVPSLGTCSCPCTWIPCSHPACACTTTNFTEIHWLGLPGLQPRVWGQSTECSKHSGAWEKGVTFHHLHHLQLHHLSIRWCRSCDRCWVLSAHQCPGVLRGREGDRVCLAGGGC